MNSHRFRSLSLRIWNDGVKKVVVRRWLRFKKYWTINNYFFGRIVELFGNQINIEGLKISVDNPQMSTHGKSKLFFKLYEKNEIQAIKRYLRPAIPVIELGGGIGVVSCVANKKLESPERHIVLEANPGLLPTLKENRRLNNCKFVVKHAALGYGSDELSLHLLGLSGSSLYQVSDNTLHVPAVSLKHILDDVGFKTATVIADIEGGEADLIEQEITILREYVKTFFFELHLNLIENSRWDAMKKALGDAAFHPVDQFGETYVYENVGLHC